jgi:TM2 domain-containing membrane protein YozV
MKSKGTAVVLAGLLGPFGADKFYVGATDVGIIQLVLTLTIIGTVVSLPWAFLSTLTLVLVILFGSATFLYPKVNWAPTTKNDKIIAWCIAGLYMLAVLGGIMASLVKTGSKSNYRHKKEDQKKLM